MYQWDQDTTRPIQPSLKVLSLGTSEAELQGAKVWLQNKKGQVQGRGGREPPAYLTELQLKDQRPRRHTKPLPCIFSSTPRGGTGPPVRLAGATPTPRACVYSPPRWHGPSPRGPPAGAAGGRGSEHPAGAMPSPSGRRLLRPPPPYPRRAERSKQQGESVTF